MSIQAQDSKTGIRYTVHSDQSACSSDVIASVEDSAFLHCAIRLEKIMKLLYQQKRRLGT